MSEGELNAFLGAVKADAGLQEKLNAALAADAIVVIAKAAGYVISADELQRAQAEVSKELGDEELGGVTGGVAWWRACFWVADLRDAGLRMGPGAMPWTRTSGASSKARDCVSMRCAALAMQ